MKHIKKKFLVEFNADKFDVDDPRVEFIDLDKNFSSKQLNGKKDYITWIKTDLNNAYAGFVHKVEGKNLVFPIPDPTLIYFNYAQTYIQIIKKCKKDLLKKLNFEQPITETGLAEIYSYFGVTSGFVIFLFTAIESFINSMIPEDFEFKIESKKKTEVYNKNQIQEVLDFKTKISEVLPSATGKDFFKNSTSANQIIWNLKEFRDEIIHTKPDGDILKYDRLIKKSLTFKYEKSLDAVATFVNFYKPKYIEECDCEAEF